MCFKSAQLFYSILRNHFVISYRIAVREFKFEQFPQVKIANLNDEQIASFAIRWFAAFDPTKSNRFIQKLKANSSIRELANNPLLLMLLCLIFSKSDDFPANPLELYKEGLNLLLKKWDAKRNIEREQTHKKVFLVAMAMLRNADYLLQLMKQQIDDLLAQDEQLQAFLTWVSQKSRDVHADYKPVTVRAFYFDLALSRALALVGGTLELARAFASTLTCNLECSLALDLALDRALALNQVVDLTLNPNLVFERVLERTLAHARTFDPMLERTLQQLLEQLPNFGRDRKKFKHWWSTHGQNWTEQLRSVMIEHRHLGYNWQFSAQQRKALKQYYNANQLLVDCLNSNFYVTRKVREEIEATLLLPIAEISPLFTNCCS